MAREKVVYEQLSKKNWRVSVIGGNRKFVVGGHGWDTLRLAERGVAAAARIIRRGRVEVVTLEDKKKKRGKR